MRTYTRFYDMLSGMASSRVRRIVSGGQTGADRGGLDAAIELGIEHGGWCPRGRLAEDGEIPTRYRVRETESSDYSVRTERNIVDSDGTLLVSRHRLTGGSALTARLARARGKPLLHIELARTPKATIRVHQVRAWLEQYQIAILNVAGPRASHCVDIHTEVRDLLIAALRSASPDNEPQRSTRLAGGALGEAAVAE